MKPGLFYRTCLLFVFTLPVAGLEPLTLHWEDNILTIQGDHIPGDKLTIWYLEAYCRDNSRNSHWGIHTVVGHKTERIYHSPDKTELKLRCEVNDGLVVEHHLRAGVDEVHIQIEAHNPTSQRSETHWAQPCVRVGGFTGTGPDITDDKYAYLKKSFVFLDGKLSRMPTRSWTTKARYTPGQVWTAPGVSRSDVNPRPLHPDTPSNGLIGCFSEDESMVLAIAFDPYQELFQGVIRCLHSDFRLGGLEAQESLTIRGKLYLMDNDLTALLQRYHEDFPSHRELHSRP